MIIIRFERVILIDFLLINQLIKRLINITSFVSTDPISNNNSLYPTSQIFLYNSYIHSFVSSQIKWIIHFRSLIILCIRYFFQILKILFVSLSNCFRTLLSMLIGIFHEAIATYLSCATIVICCYILCVRLKFCFIKYISYNFVRITRFNIIVRYVYNCYTIDIWSKNFKW